MRSATACSAGNKTPRFRFRTHSRTGFRTIQVDTSFHHEDPAVPWLLQCMPNQYCFMNSASVRAGHSFSGVVRM
ncbi:hypothetical protein LMG28138_04298 [Pararobbsia alpina]|uniref:Uncharacterized protein n=1 Tax=Pararobbsia alpina TaxID=621374 RepID=A0A6S7BGA1_9BURK|nr:hypothetical protein LMG28138_04298 [Pararobbsia alpina]